MNIIEIKLQQNKKIKGNIEGAILVGSDEDSIYELESLAITAGVEVILKVQHRGDKVNPSFYIGTGKLEEIKELLNYNNINVVIFDNDLSPAQHKNLEEKLNIKIIDRTQLILDIFAIHARSKESKLQVELAQLEYLLPKLSGHGPELSRLGGGIGTRGPGETKLEIDRRRIQQRIHRLKIELQNIKKNRELQRRSRKDPIIALVGYTNVGKSTLMNFLTDSHTRVADQLFATLDSTLRQAELPFGKRVIFTDTVGFINKLPHQLVASFSATIEEVKDADLLLHVVDASNPLMEKQISVVNKVLEDLDVLEKEVILVFNKIDQLDKEEILGLEIRYPGSITISALTGIGKEALMNKITEIITREMPELIMKIPYRDSHLINEIYQLGEVTKKEYQNKYIYIEARVPTPLVGRLQKFTLDIISKKQLN